MLALPDNVGLIYEPTNPDNFRPGVMPARFPQHLTYICTENEAAFLRPFEKLLQFQFQGKQALSVARTPKEFVKIVRDFRDLKRRPSTEVRPLLKDPIALFSAEWFADRFDADVVVTVRHPAAFAASLIRMNWHVDFDDFLSQPLIIRDYLGAFEDEMRTAKASNPDIVDQAILLWRMFYSTVHGYRERHPNWSIVRHEDLSLNPTSEFKALYEALDLDYSEAINAKIVASSTGKTQAPEGITQHILERDSKSNITSWKSKLNAADIDRIRGGTQDVSHLYYKDADW